MNKTVDKLRPTHEELIGLRVEMTRRPRVTARQLAAEFGCDPSTISKFLAGERSGSGSVGGVHSVRDAIKRIRSRKQVAA